MNGPWSQLDPGFFAPIWLGLGALAVVALILLEIGAQRRRREAIALFAAPSLVPGLTATLSSGRRLLKRVLLISAVALLFTAMARPHLLYNWSEETRTGLDLFFAFDCSRSMLTEDVKPNRLERAKLAVEDFADHVPDDRLGLVAFAGDAFLECPLTLDHDAFLSAVRDLDTETIPRPGTDIASAIDEAVLALKSQPNNLKFMILVTDGEDLEGRALAAAKSAAQAGLKIYTVGVGTPAGDVIPMRDDSGAVTFVHDNDGEIVHSKLDESMLRQIAETTGGAYEPLGQHGEGLENIYNRYIATLPKERLEERREKIRYERFEWPLALATFFLFWEFLIRDRAAVRAPEVERPPVRTRLRRSNAAAAAAAVPVLLAALLLGTTLGRAASPPEVAERDYKSGKYEDAEQKYQEAVSTQPDRPDLQYNRGDAAYKAGEYNDAEEAFRKAMETQDLSLQENSYYNLGNTQFKHGEAMEKADQKRARELWEQALHSYESALKLKDAPDTRYNYEVVKKKLEELKKQQQQQQQQQNQQQKNNPQQQQQQNGGGQSQQNNHGQQQQQQSQSGQNQQQQPQDQSGQGKQLDGKSGQDQQQQQQQSASDKNASAQQMARSMQRQRDQQDPGAKSREEAEALLDSLKDDEKRVTAASLNNGNQPPPTASGKDW